MIEDLYRDQRQQRQLHLKTQSFFYQKVQHLQNKTTKSQTYTWNFIPGLEKKSPAGKNTNTSEALIQNNTFLSGRKSVCAGSFSITALLPLSL